MSANLSQGELSPKAVKYILGSLHPPLTIQDVVYDLGSGRGLVPILAHFQFRVLKAIGVEMSESRVDISCEALDMLRPAVKKTRIKSTGQLYYYASNMLSQDIEDATVLYITATCFRAKLMRRLLMKVLDVTQRTGQAIRLISLSRGFPTGNDPDECLFDLASCTDSDGSEAPVSDISALPAAVASRVKHLGTLVVETPWSPGGGHVYLTLVTPPEDAHGTVQMTSGLEVVKKPVWCTL